MDIMTKLKRKGHSGGVYVPKRATTHKCSWAEPKKVMAIFIHFDTLRQILDFSLDQAVFKRLDGKLMRQTKVFLWETP